MSFLTCFCDLPQKEHLSSSPPAPNLATCCPPSRSPVPLAHRPPRPYLATATDNVSTVSRAVMTSSMTPQVFASSACGPASASGVGPLDGEAGGRQPDLDLLLNAVL